MISDNFETLLQDYNTLQVELDRALTENDRKEVELTIYKRKYEEAQRQLQEMAKKIPLPQL